VPLLESRQAGKGRADQPSLATQAVIRRGGPECRLLY
jgi:hypothetical protein